MAIRKVKTGATVTASTVRAAADTKVSEKAKTGAQKSDFQDTRPSPAGKKAPGGPIDPNALVQQVLRESYLQSTEDLKFYASKVKYFNSMKKQLREHLSERKGMDGVVKSVNALTPGRTNVIEMLMAIVKKTANASNEDKKYILEKLQGLGKAAQEISAYQQRISAASSQLGRTENERKKDDD